MARKPRVRPPQVPATGSLPDFQHQKSHFVTRHQRPPQVPACSSSRSFVNSPHLQSPVAAPHNVIGAAPSVLCCLVPLLFGVCSLRQLSLLTPFPGTWRLPTQSMVAPPGRAASGMGGETQSEMNPLLEIPALRLTSEVTSGQSFKCSR